ncbi:MAG: hypothetical protein AB1742_11265 [bacterium]
MPDTMTDLYRRRSPWAAGIYRAHRTGERGHNTALRALGATLVKIVFAMWKNGAEFDANIYLARRGAQQLTEQGRRENEEKGRALTAGPTIQPALSPQSRDEIVSTI